MKTAGKASAELRRFDAGVRKGLAMAQRERAERGRQTHTPGPLESHAITDHCEMCGVSDLFSETLEPSFDPSGEPKTLCEECRIGSAELLAGQRAAMLAALRDLQTQIRNVVSFDVRKHYSLMVADVAATDAIRAAEGEDGDGGR